MYYCSDVWYKCVTHIRISSNYLEKTVKLLMILNFRHCGAWSIPISRSYLSSPNKLRTQFLWRFWKKLQFNWTRSQALSRRKRVMVIIPCCRTFLSADQLQRAVNAVSTKNLDFSRETSGKYRTTQTMKLFVTFHCWYKNQEIIILATVFTLW